MNDRKRDHMRTAHWSRLTSIFFVISQLSHRYSGLCAVAAVRSAPRPQLHSCIRRWVRS